MANEAQSYGGAMSKMERLLVARRRRIWDARKIVGGNGGGRKRERRPRLLAFIGEDGDDEVASEFEKPTTRPEVRSWPKPREFGRRACGGAMNRGRRRKRKRLWLL